MAHIQAMAELSSASNRLRRAYEALVLDDLAHARLAIGLACGQLDEILGMLDAELGDCTSEAADWAAAVDRAVDRHRERPSETPT